MGTELKDTFVQAYNDTYDYINRYLTSKLPTRDLIEDALQSVYLDFYRSLITTEGENKKRQALRPAYSQALCCRPLQTTAQSHIRGYHRPEYPRRKSPCYP